MNRVSARSLLHVPFGMLFVGVVLAWASLHGRFAAGLAQPGDWIEQPAPAVVSTVAGGPAQLDEAIAPPAELASSLLTDEQQAFEQGGADLTSAAPGLVRPLLYTVQPGDSLATIAERFGIDVPTLFGSNDLDDPDIVPVGSQLYVLPVPGIYYRVNEGDTLNKISERYGVPVPEIMRANGLENSELIVPGQRLSLPGAKPLARPAPSRSEAVLTLPGPVVSPAFIWPASGPITCRFGEIGPTSPRGHAGLDIAAPFGAPIVAAASGRVLVATRDGGPYGIQVILDHGGGLRTVYGHLSRLDVEPGMYVERGTVIGLVGSTGYSTGPHLHFEVRQNGELRDPLGYLP